MRVRDKDKVILISFKLQTMTTADRLEIDFERLLHALERSLSADVCSSMDKLDVVSLSKAVRNLSVLESRLSKVSSAEETESVPVVEASPRPRRTQRGTAVGFVTCDTDYGKS